MDLEGVVPVSVPLEPGCPTEITIPNDTHIMYWCSLLPFAYPLFYRNDIDRQRGFQSLEKNLAEYDQYLKNNVEIQFEIDSEETALVRTSESTYLYGACYWNIVEPLPIGTHTAEITLKYNREKEIPKGVNQTGSPPSSPPSLYSLPGDTIVEWDGNSKVTTTSEITVTETDKTTLETDKDRFWERRDVYRVIKRTKQTSA